MFQRKEERIKLPMMKAYETLPTRIIITTVTHYGEVVSNGSEQMDWSYAEIRKKACSDLVLEFLRKMSKEWKLRRQKGMKIPRNVGVVSRCAEKAMNLGSGLIKRGWVVQLISVSDKLDQQASVCREAYTLSVTLDARPDTPLLSWYQRCRCPCLQTELLGYPCEHVSLVLKQIPELLRGFNYSPATWSFYRPVFYSELFWASTYRKQYGGTVVVPDTSSIIEYKVLPWFIVKQRGRNKARRYKKKTARLTGDFQFVDDDDEAEERRCTKCGGTAHNSTTCNHPDSCYMVSKCGLDGFFTSLPVVPADMARKLSETSWPIILPEQSGDESDSENGDDDGDDNDIDAEEEENDRRNNGVNDSGDNGDHLEQMIADGMESNT
jgi:hypothetical protein